MKKHLVFIRVISLLAFLVLSHFVNATPAYASPVDSEAEPANDESRGRFFVGLEALAGRPIDYDDAGRYWDVGGGMAFQVGWMFTPRLALMLDTHGVAVGRSDIQGYPAENNALVQGVVAIAAQYWVGRRLWIKGGIGGGELRASATVTSGTRPFDIIETETTFGALAGVGYELYQGRTIGLNVDARYAGIYGSGLNRATLVLGFGVVWYP